jgi:L-ascorbate metabolism protein UlaG (beta-lactamase superfamily)
MTPEDAVQADADVGGKVMLPLHWCTFNLAYHAWTDPPDRAVAAAQKRGVTLVVPKPGEFVEPENGIPAIQRWWAPAGPAA